MSTAPFVELGFNPTDLRPQDLPRAGAFLGSPAEALEAALAVTRASMVDQMKEELRGIAEPTQGQLLRIADLAWQAGFWRFRKVSAPIIADAYIRAYRRADAGDVPMSVIYDLADRHAEKVGEYFHTSSRQALAEGFTGMVNRRVSAKAASNRVLDAYGLTPRQMRAFTSAKQFETPVTDVLPRSLKAKARAYIDRSFTSRVKKMSRQEEHNIDQQAQQFAWMWLQDKGRLPEKAEKLWITAKDERVCEICGPLHGQRVPVNERFVTAHGEFWTPGLHPNCRCVVRLLEHRFSKALAGTALAEFNEEHPRADDGRFGTKSRTRTAEQPQRITALQRTRDPELERRFAEIVAGGIHAQPVAQRAIPQRKVVVPAPVATQQATPKAAPAIAKPKLATTTQPRAKLRTKPDTAVRTVRAGTKQPEPKAGMVYHVMTAENWDPQRPWLMLNKATAFTKDPKEAEILASELIDHDVETVTREIIAGGGTFTDKSTGIDYKLTPQQVRDVVDYHARSTPYYNDSGLEPELGVGAPLLRVRQLDDEGNLGSTIASLPAGKIAHELELERHPFEVRIIAADAKYGMPTYPEGYIEDRRAGQPDQPAEEIQPAVYGFEGKFRIKEGSEEFSSGQKYAVSRVEMEPVPGTTQEDITERLRRLREKPD